MNFEIKPISIRTDSKIQNFQFSLNSIVEQKKSLDSIFFGLKPYLIFILCLIILDTITNKANMKM